MNEKNKILLTTNVEEGYHSRVVGKNFNKKRTCEIFETSDGISKGKIPSQRDYEIVSKKKIKVQILSTKVVNYFKSKESRPIKKCKEHYDWLRMSEESRLQYNLSQICEGKKFTYSYF